MERLSKAQALSVHLFFVEPPPRQPFFRPFGGESFDVTSQVRLTSVPAKFTVKFVGNSTVSESATFVKEIFKDFEFFPAVNCCWVVFFNWWVRLNVANLFYLLKSEGKLSVCFIFARVCNPSCFRGRHKILVEFNEWSGKLNTDAPV